MPAHSIRFFHRGQTVALPCPSPSLQPTTTVLAWLREQVRCTGTKEGCNEGDCGACTVIVGELVEAAGGQAPSLRLQSLNACIQFMAALDGKALLTVEDLRGAHPAQQALVACHGSQCGFCTPGFVMTLGALHQRHTQAGTRPTRQDVADELSGNLCRCTGYRPIVEAGLAMFAQPEPALDTATIHAALLAMREAQDAVGDALGDKLGEAVGNAQGNAPANAHFHAPSSLDELAAARLALPQATLLAGGTDIGLWVNKQFRDLGEVIYLGKVAELQRIHQDADTLHIGAAASLTEAWAALARHWPHTREMGLRFASPPVRNAGTLGGNLANGSPIGDAAPVLLALGARLLLRRGAVQRELPLDQFYLDYMKNALQPGEFIQAIALPLNPVDALSATHLRAYKLSKRFDSDISSLAAGLWLALDCAGVVRQARFAFGGMAATVRRAAQAEAAVLGQPWVQATAQAAMAALAADFQPLSDLRATAHYRQRAAGNLLQRFWLETRPGAPLPAAEVSVWRPR